MPVTNGIIKPLKRGGSKSDPAQVAYWFGSACNAAQLTSVTVPILDRVYVHRRVADAFRRVFASIEAAGLSELVDKADYGGTYVCRTVRGSTAKSPHSWGIAIDLNVHHLQVTGEDRRTQATNFRCGPGQVAESLSQLAPHFEAYGFSWGGRWSSYLDPMHFEATELTVRHLEGGLSDAERECLERARRSRNKAPARPDLTTTVNGATADLGLWRSPEGITYGPVRRVAEALGATVEYDATTNTVAIRRGE